MVVTSIYDMGKAYILRIVGDENSTVQSNLPHANKDVLAGIKERVIESRNWPKTKVVAILLTGQAAFVSALDR